MAWDFFIFLSSTDEGGGPPATVVAMSAIERLRFFGMGVWFGNAGNARESSSNGYRK
jgi:hypothetical protein